jgi:L-aminopeptidase/D-esterase-like protein
MEKTMRARDLGIPFEGTPGENNAITDVDGVEVGHTTLVSGEGPLEVGKGPVRTGVTAILPRGRKYDPVFAGWYALNGNGEMTGTTWVEESGFLDGPITLTNTHSVGTARDAVIAWVFENHLYDPAIKQFYWLNPVVAETFDGWLNDINGFHVHQEHVFAALDSAAPGPVGEGCIGGGTGMVCFQFKGGIGTASRRAPTLLEEYTVGVLVQSNFGLRQNFIVAGVPVGREITGLMPASHRIEPETGGGSIIAVVATDAPLLPHQLKRLARRVPLGIARAGGIGADNSGDIFISFSTANAGASSRTQLSQVEMMPNNLITPLFEATIQATEEAILNALVAAQTMTGVNGNTVYALPHDLLQEVLRKYNRLEKRQVS